MNDWFQQIAVFLGGSGTAEVIRWIGGRRRARAETDRAAAEADAVEVASAARVTAMALSLLAPYAREQERLLGEVGQLRRQVDEFEVKLSASLAEQDRITNLFRQAVQALRDFFTLAVLHDLPTPQMSAELEAEITGQADG
ncbi:hypothetical protein ACIBCN_18910 [Nocardia sp. NPDC051052]|uniref:hypothetical protein n=1 Tax=Nocardia sp. NPDC051052 TaxID=3364322 RepID=UPI0037913775